MELTHAVGTLLRRCPELELAQNDHRYRPRNVFRYLSELQARL